MSFELNIARRLRLSGQGGRRTPSVTVAEIGIALSVAVMLLSVCVVVGFKREIREKVRGFDSDITVSAQSVYTDEGVILAGVVGEDTRDLIAEMLPQADVSLSAKVEGVLKTADNFAGVVFSGFDANHDWSFINENIIVGVVPDYSADSTANHIVISAEIADNLDLNVDDRIDAYFFVNDNMRARKFKVAGIYDTHFGDYDRLQCFASLDLVRRLASLDSVSGHTIGVSGLSEKSIPQAYNAVSHLLYNDYLTKRASDRYASPYNISDLSRSGAVYFNWLDLLDTNVVVILVLMSLVAGFTLVSCLFTLVLERVKLIGLLKALGATSNQITRVFMWLAIRIVIVGLLLGDVIGLGIALIQKTFKVIPLDPSAYYLTSVPISIVPWQIVAINIAVIAVASIILFVPSRMIAKVSPASTMRYE